MASISLYRCSDKVSGPMRFRLSDGRGVCLYWSTNCPELNSRCDRIEKESENKSPRYKVAIERYKGIIAAAYECMKKDGLPLNSNTLREVIERRFCQSGTMVAEPVVDRYREFITQAHNAGFIGTLRYKQLCTIAGRLERWLSMTHREGLATDGFDSAILLEYRKFLFDEYLYAEKYPQYYRSGVRLPRKRRKNSSVVMELRALRAFFTELEDLEEIRRSPFRMLTREKRKSIMHVMYDAPVFLRKAEFDTVCNAVVPKRLEWVRDVFVFNCCVGCRIGDVQRLGPEKLEISDDGIPFIHYIPQKTRQTQLTNREIETPLVPTALRIARKGLGKFSRLKYNMLLKELLKQCGLTRKVRIYNESKGDNEYIPLYRTASSKLARKTHVDLMNKVQIDPWASGLHQVGSNAVFRYTYLELRDRYRLMLIAFGNGSEI
ncbi:MAG: hypothetical protein ACI39U_04100 [Candidatus Cryptobacteroides sp.]